MIPMANPNKKKSNKKRVFAMILAGLLVLLLLIPYVVQIVSYAASSQEVLDQLAQLQQNAVALDQQQLELQQTIVDTQSEAMDYVARKAVIDQTIQVLQTRITNTQDQILEYNLLISARQEELDQARARESELYQHYQDRIRAMEEYGRVSYWAVLFQANSLSDMIDRIEMVQEIARADQEMMEELGNISAQIEAARDELELARSAMEGTRQALAEQQATLAQQQAQSDTLILAMTGDVAAMEEVSAYYRQQQEQLSGEIAATLTAYYVAVAQEEALAAAQAAAAAGTAGSAGARQC